MEKYSALCLLLYVIAGCVADGEYLQRFRSLIFAVFNTDGFFCQLSIDDKHFKRLYKTFI